MYRLSSKTVLLAGTLIFALLAFAAATPAKKPPKPPPEPPDPAIAYADPDPGSQADLMVMNDDGSNAMPVLENVPGSFGPYLGWSADSTQLVFNSTIDGPGVYIVDVDGTDRLKIASTYNENTGQPAWSPMPCADGRFKVAYRDRDDLDGYRDIFLVNTDGSGKIQLTHTPDLHESDRTWNPTATRLAVIRGSYTVTEQVWILDLGLDANDQIVVSNETCITCDPAHPLHDTEKEDLDWAKTDHDLIVLSAKWTGIPRDLWILDLLNPGAPIRVTDTPDDGEWEPTWSSDDSEIAFRRRASRKKDNGIWAIRPDGTGLRAIKKGGAEAPDWRRD